MQRLFAERLYQGADLQLDDSGRIRIDDLEMQNDVQTQGAEIWPQVTTENLAELTDIAGYREEFLKMFGFGLPGVDYDAHSEPHRPMI
jgi:enoyl-[acyl-carrier protein] reductase/trans-2-enoyl-CoA reductase (NAD+)